MSRHRSPAKHPSILAAFMFAVAVAQPTIAAERFSAVVSGYFTGGCYILAFPVYSPSVEWVIESLPQTFPTWTDDIQTIASADGQAVFAIVRPPSGRGLRVVRVEFEATAMNNNRSDFFDGLPDFYGGTAIAVAKNGRVFAVVQAAGSQSGGYAIAVLSRTGSLERLLTVSGSIRKIAVAADNCTMLYNDGAVIRRVNACTGATLPVFATVDQPPTDLVALSNGDLLITTSQTLQRFSFDGTVAETFPIRDLGQYGLDAVAISSDESVVVVAAMGYCENRGQIIALSLGQGRELWRRETSYISTATGVAVGSAGAPIPLLSRLALIVLATVLVTVASMVMRH